MSTETVKAFLRDQPAGREACHRVSVKKCLSAVQDKKGKELGTLVDLVVDVSNGEISELLVRCASNIDANRLPFH